MRLTSDGKTIIDSGVVLAFKENSEVVFDFTDNGINLKIQLTFKQDSNLGQTILVLRDKTNPLNLEF